MTDERIEVYIDELDHHLHLGRARRARVLAEVRDHLDDATDALIRQGVGANAAAIQAIAAFGPVDHLAAALDSQAAAASMRRIPFAAAPLGAVAGIAFVLGAQSLDRAPSASGHAGTLLQVVFLISTLAVQVAVVAGIRVAALVAATWRNPYLTKSQQALAQRSARIFSAALGIGVTGLALSLVLAGRHHQPPWPVWSAAGVLAACAAACASASVALQRRPTTDGPASSELEPVSHILFGWGEAMVEVIRAHPALPVAGIAAVAGLAAMYHAETTVSGALPWGIGEALAVLVGFGLLGPALGLRGPAPTGSGQ